MKHRKSYLKRVIVFDNSGKVLATVGGTNETKMVKRLLHYLDIEAEGVYTLKALKKVLPDNMKLDVFTYLSRSEVKAEKV